MDGWEEQHERALPCCVTVLCYRVVLPGCVFCYGVVLPCSIPLSFLRALALEHEGV